MNSQKLNKKTEVYSTSGFKDSLASPVFYPVVVVALLLGITSMFGFVQDPIKLKSMVNVINQKMVKSEVVNDSFDKQFYSLSKEQKHIPSNDFIHSRNSLEVFKGLIDDSKIASNQKTPVADDFERIAFNYDLTSENFWNELDSSTIETAAEEFERKGRQVMTIGAPLEIDYQDKLLNVTSVQDGILISLNNLNNH